MLGCLDVRFGSALTRSTADGSADNSNSNNDNNNDNNHNNNLSNNNNKNNDDNKNVMSYNVCISSCEKGKR